MRKRRKRRPDHNYSRKCENILPFFFTIICRSGFNIVPPANPWRTCPLFGNLRVIFVFFPCLVTLRSQRSPPAILFLLLPSLLAALKTKLPKGGRYLRSQRFPGGALPCVCDLKFKMMRIPMKTHTYLSILLSTSLAIAGCSGTVMTISTRGPVDPFTGPDIAATDPASKQINGGRFGCSRDNGTTWHGGIDLKAPVGTPFKAIFSGNVTSMRVLPEADPNYRLGVGTRFTRPPASNSFSTNIFPLEFTSSDFQARPSASK